MTGASQGQIRRPEAFALEAATEYDDCESMGMYLRIAVAFAYSMAGTRKAQRDGVCGGDEERSTDNWTFSLTLMIGSEQHPRASRAT